MSALRRWWPLVLAVAAITVAVTLLLAPELADARVGGGQSFGRGGGRGGGGGGGGFGGGGGGGGGGGDLIILLVYLVFNVPVIGVPLLIAVIAFFAWRMFVGDGSGMQVHRTSGYQPPDASQVPGDRLISRTRRVPGLAALEERDSALSIPVLLDFVVLVHRRAYEALSNRQWGTLAPFVADTARQKLIEAHVGVSEVSEVVVGGVSLVKFERRQDYDYLYVQFESTRLEKLDPSRGDERRVDVEEQWTFRRSVGARSLEPDAVQRLGCPNCGVSIEVTSMGACRNCDTPITAGQLQWQAVFAMVRNRRRAYVPQVSWTQGGDEGSVHIPIVQDDDLGPSMRRLQARHPKFDPGAFGKRVEFVYHALQSAWSAGQWKDARPFVTDHMYQTLRFWVERYARQGLRNRLEDVELLRVRIVKVDIDAWYESITVRLWGSMKDAIVDRSGNVVGGNARTARRFSEYWTFLRSAGGDGATRGDHSGCPSCGAPLDRINQAGICGYCGSKITTGQFDWVLSRIEQPEAYRG